MKIFGTTFFKAVFFDRKSPNLNSNLHFVCKLLYNLLCIVMKISGIAQSKKRKKYDIMEKNFIKIDKWGTCAWGIDDKGILYINEGESSSITGAEEVPWSKFKGLITEVSMVNKVVAPRGSSLACLFKDCTKLEKANLSGFITDGVIDMRSMFEKCIRLKELDISEMNTLSCSNMENMFEKCNKLTDIIIGEAFSTTGDGNTDCGRLAIKSTGKYRHARVITSAGANVHYYENAEKTAVVEKKTIAGFRYIIEDNMFDMPSAEHRFLGWNTKNDGTGDIYHPGQELQEVEEDMELYAVWVKVPQIGEVRSFEEITFGETIPFELPEILSENDSNVSGYLEISPNGEEGTWSPIDRMAILPATYNGYLVRLCASNWAGKSYSNPVMLRIKKANIDLSAVRWIETEDMVYDGETKKVRLEGLPEGVEAVYSGNEAKDAGCYVASAVLKYDRNNFYEPAMIREYEWTIRKRTFDMSDVRWDYTEPFTYDGTPKSVELIGLPDGVQPDYIKNSSVDAGIYTAIVTFKYDTVNYEKPADIPPCSWEIQKAIIKTVDLSWTGFEEFIYDGQSKKVSISNLPKDAVIEYCGEEETLAGKYLARGTLYGNYISDAPIEQEWEIAKAKYDLSDVEWAYDGPIEFDGEAHTVYLKNLPDKLKAKYNNNIAAKAGDYIATVTFINLDTHNYETPEDINLKWTITRKIVDMSDVCWDYTEPFIYDGTTKTIQLTGLPKGIYATYSDNIALNAGIYIARANMHYDEKNLEVQQPSDCQWKINKANIDISGVRWDYNNAFIYDGEEHTVMLTGLPEGLNVEYKDNSSVDAGKYVAVASLMPSDTTNYEIPEISGCTWAINKAKLDKGDLEWSDSSGFVYDGNEKSVEIISGIDENVTVEYSGNKQTNAGRHFATATFIPTDEKNYSPPAPIRYAWNIAKANHNIAEVAWDYTSEFTYDGSRKTVKLLNVPEGVAVKYKNASAVDAGDYIAVASFESVDAGNYNNNIPDMTLSWSIIKAEYNFSDVRWQEEKDFAYDGEAKQVELVGLPEGLEPVYKTNTAEAAGEYLATASFIYDEVNYEAPSVPECRWKIDKTPINVDKARWEYEEPFVYDGKEKIVRIIDAPEESQIEYSNSKATQAGTYIASADIIANDKDNYLDNKIDDLIWQIEKGNYDMSHAYWDYQEPFIYDGTDHKVVLKGIPEGVFPVYINNEAKDAGDYDASVTFKIADEQNYNVPEFENCKWTINKADPDISGVRWNYNGPFTYSSRMYELTLNGLPKGVRVVYTGNAAVDAGSYEAKAELIPFDKDNFNTPSVDGCNWQIMKADYDMSAVRWDCTDAKIYNGRRQSVMLENLPNGIKVKYRDNENTDVGKYTAMADLTASDSRNYNNPAIGDCDWEIVKADYDMSKVAWDYIKGNFIYDGKEKVVMLSDVPEEVDVVYSGNKAVDAGEYTATATFSTTNPNFTAPEALTIKWSIDKEECDMSRVKWDYRSEFAYDGLNKGIELTGLPEGVKADYEDNVFADAGTYNAIARFTVSSPNFKVPEDMECTWRINKADIDISHVRWDYSQNFIYDGELKKIELAGIPDNVKAEYTGNSETNAGKYIAHADLIPIDTDNFNAPVINECVWEIAKADYDFSNVIWIGDIEYTYDGSEKGIALTGLPEEITPIYSENKAVDVGDYTASAKFEYDQINYNTPYIEDQKWSIGKTVYDLSGAEWDYISAFTYDKEVKRIALTGLPQGLTPIYTGNSATDAGDYEAEVHFEYDERNYMEPSFTGCKWTIEPADAPIDAEAIKWNYTDPFVYDGTPKTVAIAEKVQTRSFFDRLFGKKEQKVQLEGVPEGFDIEYEENCKTEVGVYYAKAVLKNRNNENYKDFIAPQLRWEIKKATFDMSDVEWNKDRTFVYDGGEKSIELMNVPQGVKVNYINNTATKAGAYEALATFDVEDAINYEIPKPAKSVWWQIHKAEYDMSQVGWEYDSKFIYDGEEKSVQVKGLPEGVQAVSYRGNKGIEAGNYIAEVTLKYINKENFEAPSIPNLRWTIEKKRIDTSNIRWDYDESTVFVYDEKPKEVKLTDLPKEVEVVYLDNTKINAGTYTARAVFTYDTENYEVEPVADIRWKIAKANYDTDNVRWNYEQPFIYDAYEKSIVLKNVPTSIDVRYRDNKASAIGTYTAKAYLTYDSENYNTPEIETTIDWEIVGRGFIEER